MEVYGSSSNQFKKCPTTVIFNRGLSTTIRLNRVLLNNETIRDGVK